jgi:hypothetical protein
MTAKRRAQLIARDGPLCSCGCGQPGVEVEHTIPLALGGADELHNTTLMAVSCHQAKTKIDRRAIAKANRLSKREQAHQEALQARFVSEAPTQPPGRPRPPTAFQIARTRPIQSRGFPKVQRPFPKRRPEPNR